MTTQPAPAEIKHLLRARGESGGPPSGRAAGHLLLFAGLVVDGGVQLHGDKGELVLRFTRLAG
jgi:hypothetical protein